MPAKAIALLYDEKQKQCGSVEFSQKQFNLTITVRAQVVGLKDGPHGFHIHEFGDRTNGCATMGGHFDPYGEHHGGLDTLHRHAGDLGNVDSKDGIIDTIIKCDSRKVHVSIYHAHARDCVLGRGVVLHKLQDDEGRGGDEESLITGNAGARVACGVIACARV